MKVADTRLEDRTYRPNVELCRDMVSEKRNNENLFHSCGATITRDNAKLMAVGYSRQPLVSIVIVASHG